MPFFIYSIRASSPSSFIPRYLPPLCPHHDSSNSSSQGYLNFTEPFPNLLTQGMVQGRTFKVPQRPLNLTLVLHAYILRRIRIPAPS